MPRRGRGHKNTAEDFWANVQKGDGCWLWTAYCDGYGHGIFRWNGKTTGAHRIAWELTFGATDLCVLHKCDNPPCVNPDHLFKGTKGDNNRDCVAKKRHHHSRKTHCFRGHKFTDENTRYYKNGRWCRKCNADYAKATRKKKKEEGGKAPEITTQSN